MNAPHQQEALAPVGGTEHAYTSALRKNLERAGESDSGHAYAFGRAALDERRGLIDLVLLHHASLDATLPANATEERRRHLLNAAGEFLAETLSPFEMAYRGFLEANEALVGVNSAMEREAKRIARLLHDGAGQFLFALQLALAELDRELPPHLVPVLTEIRQITLQLDEQLHLHSRELYPVVLEDLGLVPALRQLLDSLERRSDMVVQFECSITARPPADIEFTLYRGVQEALTNVVKHAQASRVAVRIGRLKHILWCSVADNGIGGVVTHPSRDGSARKGLGLVSMRERMKLVSGTVEIRSKPGTGTKVIFSVPLPEQP